MRDFRKLAVWQKSHQLTLDVYQWTKTFPRDELYGMTSQVRRSASSIGFNIAEGCGREGDAELARFLTISVGSASELEYQLLLSHDLGYLADDVYNDLAVRVEELKRMLAGFLARLRPPGTDSEC